MATATEKPAAKRKAACKHEAFFSFRFQGENRRKCNECGKVTANRKGKWVGLNG